MKKEFKYEIVESIGSFGGNEESWYKGVKLVSWNGNPAKVDIRDWNGNPDSRYQIGKGISMTDEEANNLVKILVEAGYGDTEEIKTILNDR